MPLVVRRRFDRRERGLFLAHAVAYTSPLVLQVRRREALPLPNSMMQLFVLRPTAAGLGLVLFLLVRLTPAP